jgi:uncharacterized repeat protein (TIGR02543 family)
LEMFLYNWECFCTNWNVTFRTKVVTLRPKTIKTYKNFKNMTEIRKNYLRTAMLLLLMMLTATTAWAQWSGEGNGTSLDPYQIDSYAKLKKFAAIVNGGNTSAYAKLTNYIVCKNSFDDENYATDWTPIGNNSHEYTGTFNGQGYTITGLSTPTNNSSDNVGLFGVVGTSGVVQNVKLEVANITGATYVGGIVGNNSGTVQNIVVDNSNISGSSSSVGSMAGCNHGIIQNCAFIGTSIVRGSNDYTGGIAGYNSGTVKNSYVALSGSGSISATGNNAGGIVGYNGSTIESCHYSGSGAISSVDNVGGVVGTNFNQGKVRCCYYAGTGEITATANSNFIGAIIGKNNGTTEYCYYNKNNTDVTNAIGIAFDTEKVKGLTAAQFKDENFLTTYNFSDQIWLQGVVAPLLKGMPYTVSFKANGGTGSMDDQTVTVTSDDDNVLRSNTFTRDNYHFTGWNTKADGSGVPVATDVQAKLVGPETLYAQWIQISGTCGDTGTNGGDNVTWSYNTTTKTLAISGTGPMMYYGSALGSDSKYHSTAPWNHLDSELQKVIVEGDVTYIGSYAFAYCTALTSVSLPASVEALGNYVCYTSNLTRIDIPSASVATIGTEGFGYCPAAMKIAVPSTLLGTYQTATNWSTYADHLVGVLSETTGFGYTGFATGNYEYKRTFMCGVASTVCLPFSVTAAQATSVGIFYTFKGINKNADPWEVIMEEATNMPTFDHLNANAPYLFVPYIFDGKSKGDEVELTFSGTVDLAGDAGYSVWTESDTNDEWIFQGVYYNYTWKEGETNLDKVYGFAAQSYEAPDNDGDGNPDYTVSPGNFVKAAAGASIAPFRAFLQYTAGTSGAKQWRGAPAVSEELPSSMTVRLVNADEADRIGSLTPALSEGEGDWYTLDGRKLDSAPKTRGIYINGGKKVIVK